MILSQARLDKGMWWDRAWSLVEGCTHVSAGCDHCWSAAMASRFGDPEIANGGAWTSVIRVREDRLDLPLRVKKPTVWAVWNDMFHPAVEDAYIEYSFETMRHADWHQFIIITKRPERMAQFITDWTQKRDIFLPNLILGTSVEDQKTADERIPYLLGCDAACRMVSYEPALGPADLRPYLDQYINTKWDGSKRGRVWADQLIGWLVMGGESGPHARPMHPDLARRVRDDCKAAGVPFLFKQWGEWQQNTSVADAAQSYAKIKPSRLIALDDHTLMERVGKKAAGRMLDGVIHNGLPEVLLG